MNNQDMAFIVAIVVCIVLSAYFSATETAFSSINRIRMKNMIKNGNKKAEAAMKLADNFDEVLSTILIGNNIVNILSASLATILFTRWLGDAGVPMSTLAMTVVVLIFGEITPKSLAKEAPETFAMLSTPILKTLCFLLAPLNAVFGLWRKLVSILFRAKNDNTISEEELLTYVEEAKSEGGIDEHESKLISSAIEFNDLEAKEILTPRVNMIAVDKDDDFDEIRQLFRESGFSRLPVYAGSIDKIIGIIHEKDFYEAVEHNCLELNKIIKPVLFTTPYAKIPELLRKLQHVKTHLAIVVDEFGGTMGIVTLEDILEELVGEIWDEHDQVVTSYNRINESQYEVNCTTDLDDFFEFFQLKGDPESFDAQTISGWVISEIERIPSVGDTFRFEHLDITITKADNKRIWEVLVTVLMSGEEDVEASA